MKCLLHDVLKMRQVSETIKHYHESISQSAVALSEKQHVLIANTEEH